MQNNIEDFIDIHLNQPILLVGSSPNLSDFPYKDFKGKIITFGDAIFRGRKLFKADYWIAANNEFPIPDIPMHLKLINSFSETTFIFSDSAAYDILFKKSETFLEKNLNVNWCCYDERHFGGKKCRPRRRCCELVDKYPGRLTLTELVAKKYNHNKIAKQGMTIAENALALALLMGCNPIYIQGVELPLTMAEYKYYPDKEMDTFIKDTDVLIGEMYKKFYKKNPLTFFKMYIPAVYRRLKSIALPTDIKHKPNVKSAFAIFGLEKVLSNFKIYNDIAEKNNIEIFNLSYNSNLNLNPTFKYLNSNEIIKKI